MAEAVINLIDEDDDEVVLVEEKGKRNKMFDN